MLHQINSLFLNLHHFFFKFTNLNNKNYSLWDMKLKIIDFNYIYCFYFLNWVGRNEREVIGWRGSKTSQVDSIWVFGRIFYWQYQASATPRYWEYFELMARIRPINYGTQRFWERELGKILSGGGGILYSKSIQVSYTPPNTFQYFTILVSVRTYNY